MVRLYKNEPQNAVTAKAKANCRMESLKVKLRCSGKYEKARKTCIKYILEKKIRHKTNELLSQDTQAKFNYIA